MACVSPLLSLPPEIRNMIYNYMFQSPTSQLTLEQQRSTTHFRIVCTNQPDWSLSFAPLRTCRQLYFETRHLFYTLNTIQLKLSHFRDTYARRQQLVQLRQRPYLLHTQFPKGDYDTDIELVDVKRTLEMAISWSQTTLYYNRLDNWRGRSQIVLPNGVRVVSQDNMKTTPQLAPISEKKTGKREAWKRFRWNSKEAWGNLFGWVFRDIWKLPERVVLLLFEISQRPQPQPPALTDAWCHDSRIYGCFLFLEHLESMLTTSFFISLRA